MYSYHKNIIGHNRNIGHKKLLVYYHHSKKKSMVAQPKEGLAVPHGLSCVFPPETLKYWVGVQQGQSYVMGRRCLFSHGWPLF